MTTHLSTWQRIDQHICPQACPTLTNDHFSLLGTSLTASYRFCMQARKSPAICWTQAPLLKKLSSHTWRCWRNSTACPWVSHPTSWDPPVSSSCKPLPPWRRIERPPTVLAEGGFWPAGAVEQHEPWPSDNSVIEAPTAAAVAAAVAAIAR